MRKQVVESDGILGAKEARRDLGSGNNEKRGKLEQSAEGQVWQGRVGP